MPKKLQHFTGIDLAPGLAVGVLTAGWLRFECGRAKPGRRTLAWRVSSQESSAPLGWIEWYSPWRRYVFAPEPETLYEEDCLRVIAEVLEQLTKTQRATWKRRAAA